MFIFKSLCGRIVASFCVLLFAASAAFSQSTAFTYQGRLNDTNGPVNGTFEFQFVLYDAATGGNAIGNPLTVLPVTISNGLFTVNLDFGAAAFNGSNRWMDVCVGPFPNSNTNNHVYLTPRVKVNSAPYAIQALSAGTVNGAIAATNLTGTLPDARLSTNVAVVVNGNLTLRAPNGITFYSATTNAGVVLLPNATAWGVASDRNLKKNFAPLDEKDLLLKLDQVPVSFWNYKWEADSSTPNIGPVAQDFKSAFYPGRDDKTISTLEFDGVELAAIKGLHKMIKEKDAEISDLQKRVSELEEIVRALGQKK